MLLEKTTQRIITTLIMCCIIMQSIQLWSQNFFWAKAISGTNRQNIMDIQTDVAGNVIIVGIYDGTFDIDPDAGVYNLTFSGGVL
ncbi:MAG: hypothetical protein N2167_09295, partial [Flavobacteriales bacterium]|nr:hypothetical protein [Flavobacteriales bacterium]